MEIKKVLFIQNHPYPSSGILSLSSMLNSNGYETDIIISSLENRFKYTVSKIKPDLICMTAMSPERNWAKTAAITLKHIYPDTPIVIGGVHAILYTEDAINIKGIDYVCNSEGEFALLDLIKFIENGYNNGHGLKGIWLKDKNGNIVRNEAGNLIEDISQYMENRKLYYSRYPKMGNDKIRFFYASRGCLYKCPFCFNAQMQELFKKKGRYIRFKDPLMLIEEIEIEKTNSSFKFVLFTDDLFTMNKEWLKEFTQLYKRYIKIPYACQIRPEFISKEVLSLLKESGCERVNFGLETGNEELRIRMLNKNIKNDEIIEMAGLIKRYKIKLQTSNMFGIPAETLQDSFETVDLNVKIKADIISSSIYLPLPGTKLCEMAVKLGVIDPDYSFEDIPKSFHKNSILKSPQIEKQKRVHKIIAFSVRYPTFIPFIKKIVQSNSAIIEYITAPFFLITFMLSFFYRYKGDKNTFWEIGKFLYRYRKNY